MPTDRNQSSAFLATRLAGALDAATNAVVITDTAGRIVLANTQAEALFGYARDELLGQPVEMLVPEHVAGSHSLQRRGFCANPTARPMQGRAELYARRKDGALVRVDIGLTPLDVDGRAVVVASVRALDEKLGSAIVLLVEDERALRELLRRSLGRAGYRVVSAENGEAALRALAMQGGDIDLVVTDVVMPAMSGRELATRVRAVCPGMPVLFISGYPGRQLDTTLLGKGESFLAKPFSLEAFVDRVGEMLRMGDRRT